MLKRISDEEITKAKENVCGLNNSHGCYQVAQAQLEACEKQVANMVEITPEQARYIMDAFRGYYPTIKYKRIVAKLKPIGGKYDRGKDKRDTN